MTNKIITGVLVVVVLAIGFLAYAVYSQPQNLGAGTGPNHTQTENFLQGFTVGQNGATQSKYFCATATWNPGSLGSSTPSNAATSTDITLKGAVVGDVCNASLSSATTTGARVGCIIAGTATGTITLSNVSGGALDLATGTAKVCYLH